MANSGRTPSGNDGTERTILACVQAAPVFLDRDGTIAKACRLTREAAAAGASLVLFPETFVPTYPDWVWAIPPGKGAMLNELYAELVANSVAIPSPATETLCRTVAEAGVYVVIGINEPNVDGSGGSLYNTLLYIDPQGQILGKHRKLVPTGPERMVWAQGDGSTLEVYETPFGRLGGLICWENYMPLARYSMYAWGTQIYLAPTWDRGEPWLSTLRHIAKEGRVFVMSCSIALRKDDIPDRYEFKEKYYADKGDWINVGDSAIVNPDGEIVAGPLHQQEGILYAEIDGRLMRGPKWKLDVAGHYARPDVFQLIVRRQGHPLIAEQTSVSDDGRD